MQSNKHILTIILASLFFLLAVFSLSALYDPQNRSLTPITDDSEDFPETFNPEIESTEESMPPEIEKPGQPEAPISSQRPKTYTCPAQAWIDCMPMVEPSRSWECNSDYIQWVEKNCPGFEGIAY